MTLFVLSLLSFATVLNLGPVIHKHKAGQEDSQGDIDNDPTGKGPERFHAEGEHFSKAGGKTDAEEAKHEGPRSEIFDRSDDIRT